MRELDAEFVEIIEAVGPRRATALATAAAEVAADIRSDADTLGTNEVTAAGARLLRVLGDLPQITFGQS